MSNRYRGRIDAFVTLHTYSQLWIHPYGHRKDTYPGDIRELVSFVNFQFSESKQILQIGLINT